MCFTYLSKHNSNCQKQVILLMIPEGEGRECETKSKGCKAKSDGQQRWNYLAIKRLSALLKGITSQYYGDFYCLNCLHSFRTKNKLAFHKKVFENKDFCNVIMLFEDIKILEFNQYQKYDKAPFIFYADVECIVEKID